MRPARNPPARAAAGPTLAAAVVVMFAAAWAGRAWFRRDPARTPPEGGHLIVSPADGVVRAVGSGSVADETTIVIAWDVHVQRSPVTGIVVESRWIAGRRWPALLPGAAANAGHLTVIETDGGRVTVFRQAGFLARRVTSMVTTGQQIGRGTRLGRIELGSRTELHLPSRANPVVLPGSRVRAGETVVGLWT
jgi:phosphatidylserine decarboxylase